MAAFRMIDVHILRKGVQNRPFNSDKSYASMSNDITLTVVIPAYNDAQGLQRTLPGVTRTCSERGWQVIVVNDASSDSTPEVLAQFPDVLVIENRHNMGYGASLKKGILAACTEWVVTMDADGQHRLDDLVRLSEMTEGFDAVLGARTKDSNAPFVRKPGKWVLSRVANFLSGEKIPDINCGLRLLRKNIMTKLFSITSDRFSFSTSTTICLLALGCRVLFAPVTIEERIGKSSVRQIRDGLYTIMIILRLITLFSPLKIMLPAGAGMILLGVVYQFGVFIFDGFNIEDVTVLLLLSGLMTFFMGLLTDQISGLRREVLLQDIKIDQLCLGAPPNSKPKGH